MTARATLLMAALAGVSGVALGALGSHAMQGYLPLGLQKAWNTAVDYQFIHALALLGTGILQVLRPDSNSLKAAAVFFAMGIALFSGSLYALALIQIGKLGMITPVGGICLITGWVALLVAALNIRQPDP